MRLIAVQEFDERFIFLKVKSVLAERTIKGDQKEIELVYTWLPYQKRLAEYDWSTARIYKLRAAQPDPKCDESLMQMMWPEGGEQPDAEAQAEGKYGWPPKWATRARSCTATSRRQTTSSARYRTIDHLQVRSSAVFLPLSLH